MSERQTRTAKWSTPAPALLHLAVIPKVPMSTLLRDLFVCHGGDPELLGQVRELGQL